MCEDGYPWHEVHEWTTQCYKLIRFCSSVLTSSEAYVIDDDDHTEQLESVYVEADYPPEAVYERKHSYNRRPQEGRGP